MLLKMLKTVRGSENGINISLYCVGDEYEIGPSLAQVFLENEYAEVVHIVFEEPKLEESKMEKKQEFVPENKEVISAPVNKKEKSRSRRGR